MEYVTSADGTRIAHDRGGSGPPLVLVHGTTSDHRSWDNVIDALRERFTVYAVDRRGRGESGDRSGRGSTQPRDADAAADLDGYAIDREFADVVAVVEAIDEPVNLLGHSYGALCSMGAAGRTDALRRLILYEPPLWRPDDPGTPAAVIDRLYAALETGDAEAVLETFFRDVADGADRLEIYREQPNWSMRLDAAPTVPREIESLGDFRPDAEDLADVDVPTLVLLGAETGPGLAASTRRAHELLPNSELHVIEGAGHAATYTAPDRFVEIVTEFLEAAG